jgi:hypothetical protein
MGSQQPPTVLSSRRRLSQAETTDICRVTYAATTGVKELKADSSTVSWGYFYKVRAAEKYAQSGLVGLLPKCASKVDG